MADIEAMPTIFEIAEAPMQTVVEKIRHGLPAKAFVQLAEHLRLSQTALAAKLGITTRTIHRKIQARQSLSPVESEKIIRVARVWNCARHLFTSDEAIASWLMTPASPLGGNPPIDLVDTDVGTAKVEGFIKGIAYGNYQ